MSDSRLAQADSELSRQIDVGIDVVAISKIDDVRESTDDSFVDRVYTADEIEYCERKAHPTEHYAARWCVKESVRKIVTDPSDVSFREIETKKRGPRPILSVSGSTENAISRAVDEETSGGTFDTAISLSHDRWSDTAMAAVIVCGSD